MNTMTFTESIHTAIATAVRLHAGQLRKGIAYPYIVHPMAVAMILSRYTDDNDTIIAGILHDVLEDVNPSVYSKEDMQHQFGVFITKIVEEVSEVKDAGAGKDAGMGKGADIRKDMGMSQDAGMGKGADIRKDMGMSQDAGMGQDVGMRKDTSIHKEQERKTWKPRKERYLKKLEKDSTAAMMVCAADKIHNLVSMREIFLELGRGAFEHFNAGMEDEFWFYGRVVEILRKRLKNPIVNELEQTFEEVKRIGEALKV